MSMSEELRMAAADGSTIAQQAAPAPIEDEVTV